MVQANRESVFNHEPLRRWLTAARSSKAAFGGMWDSNGQWANQVSGNINNGRRHGHLVGQSSIGLTYKGFAPIMPTRSATNGLYSMGYTDPVIPYDMFVNTSYGESRYDSGATTFPPAEMLKFCDHEANGTANSFHERLHPLDYRWFDNGDPIESVIGRVAPPNIILRSGTAISSDNLTYRIYYVDGPDDSGDGSNRGRFQPSINDGVADINGTAVNANTGAIDTKYHDQVLLSNQGNRSNNLTFRPGTNVVGSVKGPFMTLGAGIWSNDRGHVMHSALHSIGGASTAHGKAAVTNASNEMIAWWMIEITRPMGGNDASLLIEICYGINDEGSNYTSIKTNTAAIINRLRHIWVNVLGRSISKLVFLLSVPQPVPQSGNVQEYQFLSGLGDVYREIAYDLDVTVYDPWIYLTAQDYFSNGWNYTGDTQNHHLSITGYAQHHSLQWQSIDLACDKITFAEFDFGVFRSAKGGSRRDPVSVIDANPYTLVITPEETTHTGSVTIRMESDYEDAVIRYELSDKEPNDGSPIYNEPLTLLHNTDGDDIMVRAKVFIYGFESQTITKIYKLLTVDLKKPEIFPTKATFSDNFNASVSYSGGGALRYTLDGSLPQSNSPRYTGPVAISQTCKFRVCAFDEQGRRGPTATAKYIKKN